MRKPRPLPYSLTSAEVVERIRARHSGDTALETFPDPGHLMAVVDYALRRRHRLSKADARENVLDAIRLVRLAQEELDRHHLWALRAAKADKIKTGQLEPATGIRSRQGIYDQIAALARKVTAARLHVAPDALNEQVTEPRAPDDRVRALARRLLDCWAELATNPDIDEWAEGIELVLKAARPSSRAAASLAAQMQLAVEDIDALARQTGQEPGTSPRAQAVVAAVRNL